MGRAKASRPVPGRVLEVHVPPKMLVRSQIIKNGPNGGQLQLGTEVVAAADGSLAALLGASPGASTAVTIMLEVLERCFASRLATPAWPERLKALFPSWGGDVLSSRSRNTAVLGL